MNRPPASDIVSVGPLPGWGWITASGLVTFAAGIAFVDLLFLHPVWLLGAVLAFDLSFQGAAAIAFGFALKATKPQSHAAEWTP